MNAYIYIDATHAGFLIVHADDKAAARAMVRKEYGYAVLPRRHVLTGVAS